MALHIFCIGIYDWESTKFNPRKHTQPQLNRQLLTRMFMFDFFVFLAYVMFLLLRTLVVKIMVTLFFFLHGCIYIYLVGGGN